MTRALDWLPFYPVSTDQLIMLEEESVTDPSRFFADLGLEPEPLAVGLRRMFGRAMSEWPHTGAFPHQHGDARGLIERIEAQLRERIEEAVEMAALKLMVDARAQAGRPAPESTSAADRTEFEATARALLDRLRDALPRRPARRSARRATTQAEAAVADEAARPLAGQVFLARQLPDYWQRFERYQREDAEERLADAAKPGLAPAALRAPERRPWRRGAAVPLRRFALSPASAQRSSHSSMARVHSA